MPNTADPLRPLETPIMDADQHQHEGIPVWLAGFGHGQIAYSARKSPDMARAHTPQDRRGDMYEDGWKTGYSFTFLAEEILRGLRHVAEAR